MMKALCFFRWWGPLTQHNSVTSQQTWIPRTALWEP